MKTLACQIVTVLSLGALAPANALADAPFPNKPIRLVVPFAPGGGADNNARRIAQHFSDAIQQSVIVDNVPGAGGTMGANKVAKAAPDGYTLLYTTPGQQMTAPFLIESLPYDAFRDLRAVSKLTAGANVLVVNKDFPVSSVEELIEYATKNPGKVNFASAGIGSTSHLAGELFKKMADVEITHVPYRGSSVAAADVIGGRVQMAIDTVSVYLPHIESGLVKALGVSTLEPNSVIPDVPPIANALPGFEASPINYLSAPGQTPEPIVKKLSEIVTKVAADEELRESFAATGSMLAGSTPDEMDALVKSEQHRWKEVIDSAGIAVSNAN